MGEFSLSTLAQQGERKVREEKPEFPFLVELRFLIRAPVLSCLAERISWGII